jgi:hypothetical protein
MAKYVALPREKHKTSIAGYMKNPDNIRYDEQVYITRGMRNKDLLDNHIILNLTVEKVVKNSLKPGTEFQELFKHFYEAYPSYIDDSVNQLNADLTA